MGNDGGADRCPVVEPFRFIRRQVDAAVTHDVTKVMMPVRTVNRIPFKKEHGPGDVGQVVIIYAWRAAYHSHRRVLALNFVGADDRGMTGGACRNENGLERGGAFVGGDG